MNHKGIPNLLSSLKPIFLTNESSYDSEWIIYNSSEYGKIERESLNITWYKYKEIVNDSIINTYISQLNKTINLTDILTKLSKLKKYSFSYSLKLLKDKLPPGYILKLIFKTSNNFIYLYSNETYVSPKNSLDQDIWFSQNCLFSDIYEDEKIKIIWWLFKTSFEFKNDTNDNRDSKNILRTIIQNSYLKNEHQRIYAIINGTIGALNTKKTT